MAEITLYGVAVSVFVAKVRIALDVKGFAYEEAPPPDGYGSPAYRAIVPAGSVPGIVIDGRPLHDSNAIVEYLEEIRPAPALLPADPYDRARARALLGYHDTRLEAAARALFPVVKRDWRAEPETVATGVDGIEAAVSLAKAVDKARRTRVDMVGLRSVDGGPVGPAVATGPVTARRPPGG